MEFFLHIHKTLLFIAAELGYTQIVKILLKNPKVNVNYCFINEVLKKFEIFEIFLYSF